MEIAVIDLDGEVRAQASACRPTLTVGSMRKQKSGSTCAPRIGGTGRFGEARLGEADLSENRPVAALRP